MRPLSFLLMLTTCLLSSGCVGTSLTRINTYGGDSFGDYPYSGTMTGFRALGPYNVLFPIDLAIDTLFLPVDLVAWPFGMRKNNRSDGLFSEGKYGNGALEALKRAASPDATLAEVQDRLRGDFYFGQMTPYWELFRTEEKGTVSFGIITKETGVRCIVSSFTVTVAR